MPSHNIVKNGTKDRLIIIDEAQICRSYLVVMSGGRIDTFKSMIPPIDEALISC